eukprot:CAMPEP_0198222432 /NCGR_PEP_ID=MMETSP1445-20131203/88063_1 /TAXON_ID=36898 /ORGANISM="Pyramimonas sp., Strain CCMP2087" /LENGTH=248 /DNA_ID=CAMNT_0043900939 /DNA_START=340 /DNA_END=1086 /DNA_ORIENTATION=-
MFLIVLASCLGAASVVGACVVYLHTNTRPLVALAGRAYPKVLFSVATRQKLVALTIDDGPHPAVTPGLLDTLSHFGVKATFFIIGSNAIRWPQLLDDIAKQGHELANHLMEDEPAYTLTTTQFEEQLIQVDNLLQPHWGAEGAREGSKWFRPGHGWVRQWMFPILKKHGYRTALGSIYAHDPMLRSKRLIASMLKKQVHPGGIIILHDGGISRKQTVDILKDVIPQYQSRGYKIVTLTELVSRTSRRK